MDDDRVECGSCAELQCSHCRPLDNMMLVAAAGGIAGSGVPNGSAAMALAEIVDRAPSSMKSDIPMCCALYIYRHMLMQAVKNNDIGQMYNAQSSILSLLGE